MTLSDIDLALTAIEELVRKKATPNRHHARELLVPLGTELLAARQEDAGSDLAGSELVERFQRARTVHAALGERWEQAVTAELELACAEHIHSADERFLSLPNYDWDYTVAARERLTARLAAAKELDLVLPELLLGRVEEADRILSQHLE